MSTATHNGIPAQNRWDCTASLAQCTPTTPIGHLAKQKLKNNTLPHPQRLSPWLNVAVTHRQLRNPPSGLIEGLDIALPDPKKQADEFTKYFPTYEDFMDMSLYDPTIGYYTTGKVRFGSDRTSHFNTFPNCLSPDFGRLAVEQAFTMWKSMVRNNNMTPEEPFTIVELGAGNGRLAHDMLEAAYINSKKDLDWSLFYRRLQYRIVERAPALQEVQKQSVRDFPGKVEILSGDARTFGKMFPKPVKGLIFTNELPDAFPVHRAFVHTDGTLRVQVLIPTLSMELKNEKTGHSIPLQHLGIPIDELRDQSVIYKNIFQALLPTMVLDNKILLSKHNLKKVIQVLDKNCHPSRACIQFQTQYLPDHFFPEIAAYRKKHQSSLDLLEVGDALNVNLGMQHFIENAAQVLYKGYMTTIDYGVPDIAWAFDRKRRELRCYPLGMKDRTHVAACDITTDIPFTQFNREGQNYFLPIFLGYQYALGHPQSQDPKKNEDWFEDQHFFMHIQKKRGTIGSYNTPLHVRSLI